MLPHGRALSLTFLIAGALLLAVGTGVAVGCMGGRLLGLGVGGGLLGLLLLLGGLFVVPVDAAPEDEGQQRPIHGVIP